MENLEVLKNLDKKGVKQMKTRMSAMENLEVLKDPDKKGVKQMKISCRIGIQ
jgi:hypothetical protein